MPLLFQKTFSGKESSSLLPSFLKDINNAILFTLKLPSLSLPTPCTNGGGVVQARPPGL